MAFTRFNLFLRRAVSPIGSKGDLTFDHVVPRKSGGVTSWENVVAACSKCNLKKGSKALRHSGLSLRQQPRQPGAEELRNLGRRFPPNHLHESWMDFLYWDTELESEASINRLFFRSGTCGAFQSKLKALKSATILSPLHRQFEISD